MRYLDIIKNLKKDYSKFEKVSVSILSESTTQYLANSIKGLGYELNLNFEINELPFDQIERSILDKQSNIYSNEPQFILILFSAHKLLSNFIKQPLKERKYFNENIFNRKKELINFLSENTGAKIIISNYYEVNDHIYGHKSSSVVDSFIYQLRVINFSLMEYCSLNNHLTLDLLSVQNEFGNRIFNNSSLYYTTSNVFSLDILPEISSKIIDITLSSLGKAKKCLILDLDNTLWGGVIGDDGIENIQLGNYGIGKVFVDFQYWIKNLKERGIILCICSKNNENTAKNVFEKHPDMVLKLKDISVFKANWKNKVDNIKDIQKILNISFDSMVFLDDNPFERNNVIENINGICVPNLPQDPVNYLTFLYNQNLFEVETVSNEDVNRTKYYQIESQRNSFKESFTNINDFLKNLNMKCEVELFNKFNTPRISQLSNRSNQFNLRTVRYSETNIKEIIEDKSREGFSFKLKDNFGDHGLISSIFLSKKPDSILFIENWIMSCRVLNRDLEKFILNELIKYSKSNNIKTIIGEYIPTTKNQIVENLYIDLGFKKDKNLFKLNVSNYCVYQTNIESLN